MSCPPHGHTGLGVAVLNFFIGSIVKKFFGVE